MIYYLKNQNPSLTLYLKANAKAAPVFIHSFLSRSYKFLHSSGSLLPFQTWTRTDWENRNSQDKGPNATTN